MSGQASDAAKPARRVPLLFIGHGNPMNAIEESVFSRAWEAMGATLPRPRGIVCLSAHWETRGLFVTASAAPRTIHDFVGFPPALFEVRYPAPGSPDLATRICRLIASTAAHPDLEWGLDHGSWSVLRRLFPAADVPVVQLSLDRSLSPRRLYELGRELAPLRDEGILLLGSGNLVHNLRLMVWANTAFDWATTFDEQVRGWLLAGDHEPLIDYGKHGRAGELAINSAEHFLPLLPILGAATAGEPLAFFAEAIWGGSISMRSLRLG